MLDNTEQDYNITVSQQSLGILWDCFMIYMLSTISSQQANKIILHDNIWNNIALSYLDNHLAILFDVFHLAAS